VWPLHTRDSDQISEVAPFAAGKAADRAIDIDSPRIVEEILRHSVDAITLCVVQHDLAAENVAISAEGSLPRAMADD